MPLSAVNPIAPPARPTGPDNRVLIGDRHEILADPTRLLPGDALVRSPEWSNGLAPARSYHVCGLEWFRGNYMHPVDSIAGYIGEMLEIFSARASWQNNMRGAAWPPKYNKNQLQDFTNINNPRLLSFPKALQTIALCEAVLKAEGKNTVDAHIVYDHMWIEPSVYYVIGLTHDLWTGIKRRTKNEIVNQLIASTGQEDPLLFDKMALGYTVTFKTANAVYKTLAEIEPDFIMGTGFSIRGRRLMGPYVPETVTR